jgi:SAM-dependent methyltransferase
MDAADVKRFFEAVAGRWDTMRLDYFDERVIERLARRTGLAGTQTMVDVGTGTAFVAAGLASHAAHVVAVDHSPAMRDVATKTINSLGITNVENRAVDGFDVAREPSAMDVAIALSRRTSLILAWTRTAGLHSALWRGGCGDVPAFGDEPHEGGGVREPRSPRLPQRGGSIALELDDDVS